MGRFASSETALPIVIPLAAAAVGAVGSVAAAGISSGAAKSAASATAAANANAQQIQQQEYQQTRTDQQAQLAQTRQDVSGAVTGAQAAQAPWQAVGIGALQQLSSRFGIRVPQSVFTNQSASAAGAAAQPTAPAASAAATANADPYSQYEQANPDLYKEAQRVTADGEFRSPADYYAWHDANFGTEGRTSYVNQAPTTTATLPPSAGLTSTPATAPSDGLASTPAAITAPDMPALTTIAPVKPDTSLSAFQADPGYQFAMDASQRALTGNLAAKGLLNSGALGNSLQANAQGLANQQYDTFFNRQTAGALNDYNEQLQAGQLKFNQGNTNYTNWFNQLSGLAGYGQTAATTSGQAGLSGVAIGSGAGTAAVNAITQAGLSTANQSSSAAQNTGAAQASSYGAQGQIGSGLISSVANAGSGLINSLGTGYGGVLSDSQAAARLNGVTNAPNLTLTTPYAGLATTPSLANSGSGLINSASLYGSIYRG